MIRQVAIFKKWTTTLSLRQEMFRSFNDRSSSVVNSFVSSVELIQAMTYKSKRDTNQNFEKFRKF